MNHKELLIEVGLGKREADVYLASLYMGPASLLALSKAAKMHRPILYKLVDGLIKRGIMKVTLEGQKKLYYAAEPKQLIERLRTREELLRSALPEFAALSYLGRQKPKITYYEGREQVQELLKTQNQASHKEIYAFFPSKFMIELFGKAELESVIRERIKKKIKVKLLRPLKSEQDYEGSQLRRKALREVRHIPDNKILEMGIVIFDNKVNLFSPARESFGIQIESSSFSNLMKYFFESLWSISKEMK